MSRLLDEASLLRNTHSEVVGHCATRRNRTLIDTCRSVHIRCSILEQAMEMQTRGHVSQSIMSIDHDPVANLSSYLWYWPLAIDSNYCSLELAIWICSRPADIEIVRDSRCFSPWLEQEQHRQQETQQRDCHR